MENIGYYNGKFDLIEKMTVPMNDRAMYFRWPDRKSVV